MEQLLDGPRVVRPTAGLMSLTFRTVCSVEQVRTTLLHEIRMPCGAPESRPNARIIEPRCKDAAIQSPGRESPPLPRQPFVMARKD
jgi:hypothetical protein